MWRLREAVVDALPLQDELDLGGQVTLMFVYEVVDVSERTGGK